jgi:membrane fusion protein (multidrug efflux system)
MLRKSFVILACGLALAGCGKSGQQQQLPPAMVGIEVVKEQAVPLVTDLPGRTSPFAVSEIRPQVSGIIKKRLFVEGSVVKAGQPLYQIDPAPYQAAFDSANATVASTKVRAERYAALLKQNAIAPQDADDAQANYLQAKANAQAARINLDYTRITAPITGRIGASSVTEGALVTANQATALATVSTLDPIYVDIDQSSTELLALKRAAARGNADPGTATVKLILEDGSTYAQEGKLQFTDVTVDPNTGAVRLRALFPNPDGILLPGLYVRAQLTQGIDPHGILVPQQAVGHNEKGEPTVLVVDAKNIARLHVLKTGRAMDGKWQVLEGLKAGEKLVVEGTGKAQADQPVTPMPAGMPAGAPPPAKH